MEEDLRVVAASGTFQEQELGFDEYVNAVHILVSPEGRAGSFVDDALAARGASRTVAATLSSFLAVMPVLEAGDCVATIPTRLAHWMSSRGGFEVRPLPIAPIFFEIAIGYLEETLADPAMAWFFGMLQQIMTDMNTAGSNLS